MNVRLQRPRRTVPRVVVRLLSPIYRRSVSRSNLSPDGESIYIWRGVGKYGFGPVLRTNPRVPTSYNGFGLPADLNTRKPSARV